MRKTADVFGALTFSVQQCVSVCPTPLCLFQPSPPQLDIIYRIPHCVPISAHHKWNFDDLLEKMWAYLKLVRV